MNTKFEYKGHTIEVYRGRRGTFHTAEVGAARHLAAAKGKKAAIEAAKQLIDAEEAEVH